MDGLRYVAWTYFHQDFDTEYTNPMDGFIDFKLHDSPQRVVEAAAELEQLLRSTMTDEQMADLWVNECDAYFEPDKLGMTYRAFLEYALSILRGTGIFGVGLTLTDGGLQRVDDAGA